MLILAQTSTRQSSELDFAGMPDGWMRLLGFLLVGAIAYGIVWLYRREARVGAGHSLRLLMAALRLGAVLLLVVIWLEPVIATYTIRTRSARVAVLTDVSQSMSIADDVADEDRPTRIEQAVALVSANQHAWLRRLADRNEPAVYTFGEDALRQPLPWLNPPESQPADLTPAYIADQQRTDLGRALTTVFEDAGDVPLAGVVLITDGAINSGMNVEDVAAFARRAKVPLYTVGVGSVREPPNVRVTTLTAPTTIPKGDPLELRAQLAAEGILETPFRVELTRQRIDTADSTTGKLIASRTVVLGPSASTAELRFSDETNAGGEYLYRLSVSAIEQEAVTSDNVRTATVLVLDERLRVLIVAGRPSYEYRYLTRLLERDATIDLSCWLQSADAQALRDGNTIITALPQRPEELFAYDAVLLLDPDPRELDSSWAIMTRRFVDEFGGGLLVQAGPHFASRFVSEPRLDDLIKMLPVVFDDDADVRLSEQGSFRTVEYPIVTDDHAGAHPLLQLHNSTDSNRAVWAALPGVWWYLPVLREKPLATVLLRHGGRAHTTSFGPTVLMASQPFGAGRTAYLGFESTWRWRSTGEVYFNRFWIQLVRYLAQTRRQGVSKRGTIVLDRDTFRVGDYVRVEARVLDDRFVPWHESHVQASVELDDGETRDIELEAIPGREGWFAARLTIDWSGAATIRVPLPESAEADSEAQTLRKRIDVRSSDIELQSLRLNREALAHLAEQTGGRYVPLAAAGALPDWIENATQIRSTRLPDHALWDNGWVLMVIATLLCIEWTLRRRNHLL